VATSCIVSGIKRDIAIFRTSFLELSSDYFFFNRVNRAINFSNRALIAVLTYVLFVTFFNLFVFNLQVDVVGPVGLR